VLLVWLHAVAVAAAAVVVVVVVVVDNCRFCSRSCWCVTSVVVTTLLLLPLSSALYSRLAAQHRFSIDPYKVYIYHPLPVQGLHH
jgi:hypothetical protein